MSTQWSEAQECEEEAPQHVNLFTEGTHVSQKNSPYFQVVPVKNECLNLEVAKISARPGTQVIIRFKLISRLDLDIT